MGIFRAIGRAIVWIGEVTAGVVVVGTMFGVLVAGILLGVGFASGWTWYAQTLVTAGVGGIVAGAATVLIREAGTLYGWVGQKLGWRPPQVPERGDIRAQVTELLHLRLGYVLRQTDVSVNQWQLQIEKNGIPFTLTKVSGDEHLTVSLKLNVAETQMAALRDASLSLRQELVENLTRDMALVDVESSHNREEFVVTTIMMTKYVLVRDGVDPVELLAALNGILRAYHVAISVLNRTVRLATELAQHGGENQR